MIELKVNFHQGYAKELRCRDEQETIFQAFPITLIVPGISNEVAGSFNQETFKNLRYQIITPEVMRGQVFNQTEGRTIAKNRDFTDDDLGLYEMYLSYDWDDDGVSNLAEVENSTRYEVNTRDVTIPSSLFNPLQSVDTPRAERLKMAYSRGNVSMQVQNRSSYGGYDCGVGGSDRNTNPCLYRHFPLDSNDSSIYIFPDKNRPGLGEISNSADGGSVEGLRLPTFGPGIYDFPSTDPHPNMDVYTTAPMIRMIEMVGRKWALIFADKDELEEEPGCHNFLSLSGGGFSQATCSTYHAGNYRIGINDLSGQAGGANGSTKDQMNAIGVRHGRAIANTFLWHVSHQNGRDIDLRYMSELSADNDGVERSINLSKSADREVYSHINTIRMLVLFREAARAEGFDIDNIWVGDKMSDTEFTVLDNTEELSGIVKGRIGGHNDHIHLKFTDDVMSRPQRIEANNRVLELWYVPPPENGAEEQLEAAREASTHRQVWRFVDGFNNPLLPWTRLSFSFRGTNGQDENSVVRVRSTHLHDNRKLWVNHKNTESDAGVAELDFECLSVGDVDEPLEIKSGEGLLATVAVSCVLGE